MNQNETLRISQAPVATAPSREGNLSQWHVSTLLKKENGIPSSTGVNLTFTSDVELNENLTATYWG
jgi:hypothetical protein